MGRFRRPLLILVAFAPAAGSLLGCKSPPPTIPAAIAAEPSRLFFGDLHMHSGASAEGSQEDDLTADLDAAYRWARGGPVVHPYTRARVQLERPLDFVVVADPAAGLDPVAWQSAVEAAERHYAPCSFTTFIGWEWSAERGGYDLHRVVLLNGGGAEAREITPFSSRDGAKPEDLWDWLGETNTQSGIDFIAIPHAPNLSGGLMYSETDSEGGPISAASAEARMRWEPVAEVTQVKGDSETHPILSPDDPFADFERFPTEDQPSPGAYARTALLRGLQISSSVGANPFQFAMIGSTGASPPTASTEEAWFWGATPDDDGGNLSAQGLTAVWATENTRTAIFDALKRGEVYATTGPRIRVRFFGSWGFDAKQAKKPDMVNVGYTFGHPMGSELTDAPKDKTPGFLMYAVKDPEGANLDRIQMIKGWLDTDGNAHERVFDVVWSGNRERGPDGKVPPVTDAVDLETASYLDADGSPALHGFWSDPDFDPERPAFYYLRVLQVPTPRHTLYDAVARGIDPETTGHPASIQERAYTTPIWYSP